MRVQPIHYSNGRTIEHPVVQVWDDLHEERSGFYRAFWCAGPDATTGSPVIGYCSPGGSYNRIWRVCAEVWRMYPEARIYRNGREIHDRLKGVRV